MKIELPENIANILQSMQVQNITSTWSARNTEVGSKSNTTSGSSSSATLGTASSSHSSIASQILVNHATMTMTSPTTVDSTSLVEVHQVDTNEQCIEGVGHSASQENEKSKGSVVLKHIGGTQPEIQMSGGIIGIDSVGGLGETGGIIGAHSGIGNTTLGGCAVINHPSLIEVIPIQNTDSSESEDSSGGF